jgi:hypothetical protein
MLLLVFVDTLLILGVGHVLYRELQAIRNARPQLPSGLTTIRELQTQLESQHQTEIERLRLEARTTIGALQSEVAALQTTLQSLTQQTSTLAEQLPAETEPASNTEHERDPAQLAAIADLYEHLVRLDTAFLALANPVLLPGEPFTPADQVPADALRWESWKDIGDEAFAFAEAVAARRLHLDEELRRTAGEFVALIRQALTSHVYPALAPGARIDPAERMGRVEATIQNLAVAIGEMRRTLEAAHRRASTSPSG